MLAGNEQQSVDAWEWDGTSWQRSAGGGSVPLVQAGMVFDSVRRRLVAFGPASGYTQHSTFEWDGRQWLPRSVYWVGPSPRSNFAMTFDAAAGQTLMFGGEGGGDDLWRWDGAAWTRVPRANPWPSARIGAAMAFDPARGRTVLFGGLGAAQLGDTWEWDGAVWTQHAVAGPSARSSAAMVHDPGTGRIVLFGGQGAGGLLDDTWEFDGAQWTQRPAAGSPGPRSRAGLIATPGGVMLVGGRSTHDLDDTWQSQGGAWTALRSGDNAPPLMNHRMVYDEVRGEVVAFGGTLGPTGTAAATGVLTWNGAWTKHSPAVEPATRTGFGMVFDRARGVTMVFGGALAVGYASDTWTWDGSAWTQHVAGPQPAPRTGHGLAYDSARQRVVLFGGGYWVGVTLVLFGDTWLFDGSAWQQASPANSPAPQNGTKLTYDEVRAHTVLVGAETWEWDGADWALRGASVPEGATHTVFDPGVGRVLAIGNSAVHMWTGTEWTAAPVAGIPSGYAFGPAFVFDPARQRLLASGGYLTQPQFGFYGRASNRLYVHGPTPAGVAGFGAGCGGAAEPVVRATGLPALGNPGFSVDAHTATGAVPLLLGIAFATGQTAVAPGCTLLLGAPADLAFLVSSAGGYARRPLAIPAAPSLRGLPLYCQAAALAPALALSAGLRVVVGD